MPIIYQFPTPIPMTNGNFPQFKFAVFGDDVTSITTPGYLNASSIEAGIPLSNSDVVMALYNYSFQTSSGSFAIFTVNISTSNGQITLTEWSNPGEVVLPTTANYLAHFTNSTGTISSASSNVTQPGNISAGFSGHAGTLTAFPAIANRGSLTLVATANVGNTNTIISNVPMNQATTVRLPDPGFSNSTFVLTNTTFAPNALIISTGVDGVVDDSSILATDVMRNNFTNQMTGGGGIILQKVDGTESGGNLTTNGYAGQITTSSLTTVQGGSYTINWTNPKISLTSSISLQIQGGTNNASNAISFKCIPASGSATLIIYNDSGFPTPLNGTLVIGYTIF